MKKNKLKCSSRLLRVFFSTMVISAMLTLSAFTKRQESIQDDKIATYKQGEQEMYRVISKQIRYPVTARNQNRSGVVMVTFTVDERGKVENVEANSGNVGHYLEELVVVAYSKFTGNAMGVDKTLEAESIRVVQGLGEFNPAYVDGKPVRSVLTIPIRFKLN